MKAILLIVLLLGLLTQNGIGQKQSAPVGGQPKDFVLPRTHKTVLQNGLQATFVPYGSLPKTLVRAVVRTGRIDEQKNEVWLANLVGEYLKEGSMRRNAQAIANMAADMGGSIEVNVQNDQTIVSCEVLSEFTADAIELLAEVVCTPAFPSTELERLKTNQLRELNVTRSRAQTLATEKFNRVLYGEHPYGWVLSTDDMLRGFSMDMIRGFYGSHYGAKRTHLFVVGRFDESIAEKAVREYFSKWNSGDMPTEKIPSTSMASGIYLVDRPGAPQSTIYLGLPVVDPSNPDYLKLVVTNTLLGGFFSSRITSNIREDKGYTYSPTSLIQSRYRTSYWAEVADVTTNVTGAAIKEILFEIDRLKKEAPSLDEVEGVKNYQAGVFVLQNSTFAGIANQLGFLNLHGLSETYLTDYVRNVHATTSEDISDMARKYLKTKDFVIVVVGDITKVLEQVKPFGAIIEK